MAKHFKKSIQFALAVQMITNFKKIKVTSAYTGMRESIPSWLDISPFIQGP